MGIWEWAIYGLMGGVFRVWQLWQSKLLFRLEICSENADLQGSPTSIFELVSAPLHSR